MKVAGHPALSIMALLSHDVFAMRMITMARPISASRDHSDRGGTAGPHCSQLSHIEAAQRLRRERRPTPPRLRGAVADASAAQARRLSLSLRKHTAERRAVNRRRRGSASASYCTRITSLRISTWEPERNSKRTMPDSNALSMRVSCMRVLTVAAIRVPRAWKA